MTSTLRRWLTHPAVLFALAWAGLLAVLFAPLLAGGVFANPQSDMSDGYVTRRFAAEVIRRWGEIPRWDPYIFGGMPFLGAMHGDQAYPISIALRAIFPPALGIGLGMVLHLWLGAVGLLVFLRRLGQSWGAAIVGATAYGLGGPLIGLLYPGHDGKIFVLGLLPWGMIAVLSAARTARLTSFAGWGTVLGLMLLSPHFQMAYYSSLLLGAFLLLLLFTETPARLRWRVVGGMALGSVGGLLLAGAQLFPFAEYLPYSPRAAAGSTSTGWQYATSFSLPANELIGTLWGGFNGWHDTYWGTNVFKLHSDYLGLLGPVLALTALVALWRLPRGRQRRITWFWFGAALFGMLWALGGQTPFYYLPYTLLPFISKTRAPGMIWGQVSMLVAILASMGFARLESMEPDERAGWAKRALFIGGAATLLLALGSGGLLPSMAKVFRQEAAFSAVSGARLGIVLGGLTVVAFAAVAWKAPRWMVPAAVALIATDLVIEDRRFITIDPRGDAAFAADAAVQAMEQDAASVSQPWRVLPYHAYSHDYLIGHKIRSVLGYHGNELHRYDELLGGKNQWPLALSPQLWRLLALRYILSRDSIDVPGLVKVAGPVIDMWGEPAWVWRVPNATPWAWVAPIAIGVPDEQAEQIVINPGFDPARAVLVSPDAPFASKAVPPQLPPAVTPAPSIAVTEGRPGEYTLKIDGLTSDAVLVVSENWFPSWTAKVDGRPAPLARANFTFMAVPLPAGAKEVVLTEASVADRRGRYASFAGAGFLLVLGLAGVRRRGPAAGQPPAA